MAKRVSPLHVCYRLQAEWSTVAEKEALPSRIPQVRQLFRPPGSCLVDNSTLLNAMCDAVEREPTQLPAQLRLPSGHGELPLAILYNT